MFTAGVSHYTFSWSSAAYPYPGLASFLIGCEGLVAVKLAPVAEPVLKKTKGLHGVGLWLESCEDIHKFLEDNSANAPFVILRPGRILYAPFAHLPLISAIPSLEQDQVQDKKSTVSTFLVWPVYAPPPAKVSVEAKREIKQYIANYLTDNASKKTVETTKDGFKKHMDLW